MISSLNNSFWLLPSLILYLVISRKGAGTGDRYPPYLVS